MKHTAIITANTKLPKGWTYKDGKATKGNLTIYSKETYTLTQKPYTLLPHRYSNHTTQYFRRTQTRP